MNKAIRNSVLIPATAIAAGMTLLFSLDSCKKKPAAPPRKDNEIYLLYKTFNPQLLTVKKGGEVIFTNRDNANHSVTSNSGLFQSGKIQTDQSYTHTFEEEGSYYFYCSYHSSNQQETGVIEVTK